MKTAIVVGANGFLGSALVNKLLEHGINVIAVYHSKNDNINPIATLISTQEILCAALQPDYIFYAVGNYANTHAQLIEINRQLELYMKKFPLAKFVYISSTNIYGTHQGIISESSSFNNPGVYALSKIAGEFIVSSLKNFVIIRLTYLYGLGITNNSFIPVIIRSSKEKGEITLLGDGSRYQDYLFIDDAAELCVRAAQQSGSDYYLAASGITTTNKEVAEEISKHVKCTIKYEGTNTAPSFEFDPSKTFEKLGWRPTTTVADGIKRMLK